MSDPRRQWTARLLLPAALAAVAIGLVETDWLWRADLMVYDVFRNRSPQAAPPDVVLVAIDEPSLQRLGRWPWRRSLHADLIERLTRAGARAVALDIAFAEPDADDHRLAEALRASGRVVLPILHEQMAVGGAPVETRPTPEVGAAAAALGHVDVEVDLDGIVRSVYLQAGLGRPAWPHLALAMLQRDPTTAPRVLPGETDPDPTPAPDFWMRDRRVLVPFAGPPGHFRRVSYVDVLDGHVDDGLRGTFVLIGLTATGLGDRLPTPVSGLDRPMPGIEFNANVLEALRRGTTAQYLSLNWTRLLTGLLVFLIGVSVTFVRRQALFALVALVGVVALSWALLTWFGRWFAPIPAMVGVLLAHPVAAWRWRLLSVAHERARADVALHSLAEGVITADAKGRIDYMNAVAANWVGEGNGLGAQLGSVLRVADDLDPTSEAAVGLSRGGVPVDATLVTRTGTPLPVIASIVAIGDGRLPRRGTVVALLPRDRSLPSRPVPGTVAEPPSLEAAGGDAVAGLPARARLEAQLGRMIAESSRTGRVVAVLVLDITRLRHVNVAFGRRGGDTLLQAVAGRLRGAIREREAVGHVGGDEFVVLSGELRREEDAVALATRLIKVVDAPFSIDGVEVRVRASCGLALSPGSGTDAEALLQQAETAKSWARDHGQAPVQIYGPHMSAPALDRLVLERALQAALEQDQLELVYQPQVDVTTGAVVGAEALVRWTHPEHGHIPTSTFIALAEETQLIVGLGEWVLRTACRQLAEWRARGVPPIRLAVNVSPRQVLEPGLCDSIGRALRDFALDPGQLEIEITESVLVRDIDRARTVLDQIKAMGVVIALDDFGVGYSSLGYLSRFPVDCVKIDRSFVDNVTVDGHDRTICLAVLAMARSMQRRVIAEGVETLDQFQFFASKGCDLVQGYFFSRPVSAQDIERLVQDRTTFPTM